MADRGRGMRALQLGNVQRRLLKLVLLLVAAASLILAIRYGSTVAWGVLALSFGPLWLLHGRQHGFGPAESVEQPGINPLNGNPIIPGAHGLDSQGNPPGAG